MWPHSAWAIAWSVYRGAYHVFMAYVITFFLDYVRAPSSMLRVLDSVLDSLRAQRCCYARFACVCANAQAACWCGSACRSSKGGKPCLPPAACLFCYVIGLFASATSRQPRAPLTAACTAHSMLALCAQVWIQKDGESLSEEMRNEALMSSPCCPPCLAPCRTPGDASVRSEPG